jgi:ATP-binding cassette subfamily D (ALD) long-chain fatty acid import protein
MGHYRSSLSRKSTHDQVPRVNCKESALLLAHFAFLIGRTWLSLIVARLDGAIVRDLVAANGKGFAKGLIYWFLIAIPASYNNAMVKNLEVLISLVDSLSSI